MAKIIFFTAGETPTGPEQSLIDQFKAGNNEFVIRSALRAADASYGSTPEPCDSVAGSPPASHTAKPRATPGAGALGPTQAIVTNAQKVAGVTGSGTFANITVNPTTKAITIALTAS